MLENPYDDARRSELWEMCVRRDLEALLAEDWSVTGPDFDPDGFLGIDACMSADPADWKPAYPSLECYREEFERQAHDFNQTEFAADPRPLLYAALTLSDPVLSGDRGLIVKNFDGSLPRADGTTTELRWQSAFHLRRTDDRWRFSGFVGYLPLP